MKTLLLLILSMICGGCVTVNHPPGFPIPSKEQMDKHAETLKKNREYREETKRMIEEERKERNPYPTTSN